MNEAKIFQGGFLQNIFSWLLLKLYEDIDESIKIWNKQNDLDIDVMIWRNVNSH